MSRFTQPTADGAHYVVAAPHIAGTATGYTGPAIDRLASFENMHSLLQTRIQAIPAEQAALRAQGREKSVRFRELTAQKLTYQAWLDMARDAGIEES